jgi:hypothetical protein
MVKFGEVILPVKIELPQIFCFCWEGMQREDFELIFSSTNVLHKSVRYHTDMYP